MSLGVKTRCGARFFGKKADSMPPKTNNTSLLVDSNNEDELFTSTKTRPTEAV
jgi:hypothetical protein